MRFFTSSLFLCLLIGCANPAASNPGIAWQFDPHNVARDHTGGKVSLVVDGERHLITDDPVGEYRIVTLSEYKRLHIPNDAVSACSSWWAGVGEEYYVKAEPDRILVFRREYGETLPKVPPYSLFRTIPVRRTVSQALKSTAAASGVSAYKVP